MVVIYDSNMSQPEMVYLPHKLSVTEDGLTAETGLAIKIIRTPTSTKN